MFLSKIENSFLFLVIAFLPTQLGKHFWPEWSLIFSIRTDYLSPTIYFWDLLVLALLLIWFTQKPFINRTALNLLLIFILTQVLSILFSINIGAGLVRAEQYLITGFLGVYIASIINTKKLKFIINGLVAALLFESVLGIAQFFKQGTLGLWILGERTFTITTPSIAKFDYQGIQFLRPYGTLPHPNVLAAFLVISLIIVLGTKRVKVNRLLIWFSALLASLTLLLTVSRTVLVTYVLEAFYFLKLKPLIILVIIGLLISPVLYTRFTSLINFDSISELRREELDDVALKLISDQFIFGVGLNNFIDRSSRDLIAGSNRFLQPVHNIYLLTLAETGIVGFAGLLIFITYPVYLSVKKGQKHLILAWMTILFLGLFDHYFLTLPQGQRLLFLIWGLSLAKANIE